MPLLLNLRALCASCERAEALYWVPSTRTALCAPCLKTRPSTQPVATPIVPHSVITALCSRCAKMPATVFAVEQDVPLCETCSKGTGGGVVPVRESVVADGLVFDKMDFSGIGGRGGTEGEFGNCVDLSYYKTPVPLSLVGKRKRLAGRGERGGKKDKEGTERREGEKEDGERERRGRKR